MPPERRGAGEAPVASQLAGGCGLQRAWGPRLQPRAGLPWVEIDPHGHRGAAPSTGRPDSLPPPRAARQGTLPALVPSARLPNCLAGLGVPTPTPWSAEPATAVRRSRGRSEGEEVGRASESGQEGRAGVAPRGWPPFVGPLRAAAGGQRLLGAVWGLHSRAGVIWAQEVRGLAV